jgi:hypothetical protein
VLYARVTCTDLLFAIRDSLILAPNSRSEYSKEALGAAYDYQWQFAMQCKMVQLARASVRCAATRMLRAVESCASVLLKVTIKNAKAKILEYTLHAAQQEQDRY